MGNLVGVKRFSMGKKNRITAVLKFETDITNGRARMLRPSKLALLYIYFFFHTVLSPMKKTLSPALSEVY